MTSAQRVVVISIGIGLLYYEMILLILKIN